MPIDSAFSLMPSISFDPDSELIYNLHTFEPEKFAKASEYSLVSSFLFSFLAFLIIADAAVSAVGLFSVLVHFKQFLTILP